MKNHQTHRQAERPTDTGVNITSMAVVIIIIIIIIIRGLSVT